MDSSSTPLGYIHFASTRKTLRQKKRFVEMIFFLVLNFVFYFVHLKYCLLRVIKGKVEIIKHITGTEVIAVKKNRVVMLIIIRYVHSYKLLV